MLEAPRFTLRVSHPATVEEYFGVDCGTCGAVICEASADTIARDPEWLTDRLREHELSPQ